MLAKYKTRKDVVVEAAQYTEDNREEFLNWSGATGKTGYGDYLKVLRLGPLYIRPGEWLVKHNKELHVYGNEQFHQFFEKWSDV